ncbi:hypothetical protein ACT5DM_004541 [Vibrio alginolyticus]
MRLYRGFLDLSKTGISENIYLKTPRLPRDLHIHIHETADGWFYERFGIKARSQTIFCTPDIEQAKEYGTPYVVTVPTGTDYKLIFSVKVKDFIEIEADISDVNSTSQILDWLENKSYSMVTDFKALPSDFEGEVMLHCTHYEVLNT